MAHPSQVLQLSQAYNSMESFNYDIIRTKKVIKKQVKMPVFLTINGLGLSFIFQL